MADAVVIHKADGSNLELAQKAKANYQNALHLMHESEKNWSPNVLLASSTTGLGLELVWDLIREYEGKMRRNGFWESNRAAQRLNWLEDQIHELLGLAFFRNPQVRELLENEKVKVQSGELNPGTLAKSLIQLFLSKN